MRFLINPTNAKNLRNSNKPKESSIVLHILTLKQPLKPVNPIKLINKDSMPMNLSIRINNLKDAS